MLKNVAEALQIPVMVTNQITTQYHAAVVDPSGDKQPGDSKQDTLVKGQIIPALGNTWSHCVTTRILLHSIMDARRLVIAKSPQSPMVELGYTVGSAGVVQSEDFAPVIPQQGEDAGHFAQIEMGGMAKFDL